MSDFTDGHLRLVTSLGDTLTTGAAITAASQDGKKRTSAQRSRDLMDGRYFVHSILRVVDRDMYYGTTSSVSFSSGVLDVSAYGIVSHKDLNIDETSVRYNKPVAVVPGGSLPFYRSLLNTAKPNEIIIAVVANNAATPPVARLKLIKGANVSYGTDTFIFDIGFYRAPKLTELTASSGGDYTEPRVWFPAIEAYALYLARLGSDTERAQLALTEAYRLAQNIVTLEYGGTASRRVAEMLGGGNG